MGRDKNYINITHKKVVGLLSTFIMGITHATNTTEYYKVLKDMKEALENILNNWRRGKSNEN